MHREEAGRYTETSTTLIRSLLLALLLAGFTALAGLAALFLASLTGLVIFVLVVRALLVLSIFATVFSVAVFIFAAVVVLVVFVLLNNLKIVL